MRRQHRWTSGGHAIPSDEPHPPSPRLRRAGVQRGTGMRQPSSGAGIPQDGLTRGLGGTKACGGALGIRSEDRKPALNATTPLCLGLFFVPAADKPLITERKFSGVLFLAKQPSDQVQGQALGSSPRAGPPGAPPGQAFPPSPLPARPRAGHGFGRRDRSTPAAGSPIHNVQHQGRQAEAWGSPRYRNFVRKIKPRYAAHFPPSWSAMCWLTISSKSRSGVNPMAAARAVSNL